MPRTLHGVKVRGSVLAVPLPAKKVPLGIKARPETRDFKGTALEKDLPISKPALPYTRASQLSS